MATAVAVTCGWSASAPVAPGLPELYRLDRLPTFRTAVEVGSVSSYDRSGGNDDGFSGKYSFLRKEGDTLVLADLKGPGVIYRVWTPTPTEDTLEFLFDGEEKPRVEVKFRELFLGRDPDFPAPLVGFGAGGYFCYVPIPFEKSCVVRMRAPKVQFYQINYARYGEDSGIRSFRRGEADPEQLANARKLFSLAGRDVTSFSRPEGEDLSVSRVKGTLQRGALKLFQANEGGRILALKLGPADGLARKARDLVLRISFDGAAPAVLCPVGDFFGYAWGQPAMQSLLVGTSGTTNYCYFPMPFERSASVELVSEGGPPVEVVAEVVHSRMPKSAAEGKFYAVWRRENPTTIGKPYTFIETQGRGHLAGVILLCQGKEVGKTLYFEGDDQTIIDGRLAVHGTGSEDFFNGGWYDVPDRWEKRISFPLSGCLGYAKHLGRTGAYRLFLGDVYSYRQSLVQTIEHSGQKNDILTDHSSVTFLYSENPPLPELTLPPLAERAVDDPREIIFAVNWQMPTHSWSFDRATLTRKREKIGGEEVRYLSLSATGDDWFGPHFITLTCDIPEAGRHAVYLEAVTGPDQGIVQVFQNENPVARPLDMHSDQPGLTGRKLLGHLDFVEGNNNLMLKLVGKNEKANGLGLGLVQIICVREGAGP